MTYEKDIILVLHEAGEAGLSIGKISRHVFNVHNSFFGSTPKEDIHKSVKRYLTYHSKRRQDTIEKVSWGVYRLNTKSKKLQRLLKTYIDVEDTPQQTKQFEGLIPNLFEL